MNAAAVRERPLVATPTDASLKWEQRCARYAALHLRKIARRWSGAGLEALTLAAEEFEERAKAAQRRRRKAQR